MLKIYFKVPQESFVTFKIIPINSNVASNLAAFGTPWGRKAGRARRTMRLGERRVEEDLPKFSFLGSENIPWFGAQEE